MRRKSSRSRRVASRNPVRAERYREEDYTQIVGEGEDAYERTRTRTITYGPTVSRGHFDLPATRAATKIAERVKSIPGAYSFTRDGKSHYATVKPLGSGNFGIAFQVEAEDATHVVKLATAQNLHGRPWTRMEQSRNLRQEAGIANELVSLGYTVIPRTIYVEFDGATPALVREYGEPVDSITAQEYERLERELFNIESVHNWRIHDDLALYRRRDGSIFVGDVGFWQSPQLLAKGAKRRAWNWRDSSLDGLLKGAQRQYGPAKKFPTLPELVGQAEIVASFNPKNDDFAQMVAEDFLKDVASREAIGLSIPGEAAAAVERAERIIAGLPYQDTSAVSRRKRS